LEILLLLLFGAIIFVIVVSFAQRAQPLPIGSVAPAISLTEAQTGAPWQPVRSGTIVCAFLPRDETSRCLTQIREFEAAAARFAELGVEVALVSVHSAQDSRQFAAKHNMTVPLLADERGMTSRAFGSIIDFGIYKFSKRETFVIRDGHIARVYAVTEPKGHAASVLAALTPP
jgi:thioredoxin-dependent peroxiredoxin